MKTSMAIGKRFWRWIIVFGVLLGLSACGGGATEPAATPTMSAEAAAGELVFVRECARCHSTVDEAVIVGPSLAGVATRAGGRVAGQDAHAYLLTSIMRPGDYLVEGYQDLMPQDLAKSLTGEEIDQVVAYLLTLH
jgi:nitric oxide reductase subunit C